MNTDEYKKVLLWQLYMPIYYTWLLVLYFPEEKSGRTLRGKSTQKNNQIK